MTNVPVEAISELVRYLADERRDYRDQTEAGEDVSSHIFQYVEEVAAWLDSNPQPAVKPGWVVPPDGGAPIPRRLAKLRP